jgi:hypothetical protein
LASEGIERRRAVKPKTFKPNDLATIQLPTSSRRRVVEVISHPIPAERFAKPETIKVRMVPGEPTTLVEVWVEKLAPVQIQSAYRYVHVAEVRCAFTFPEDMLRYDGAALYRHDLHEDGEPSPKFGDRRGLRISEETDLDLGLPGLPYVLQPRVLVYRLSSTRKSPWTVARWHSFSASITPLIVRDLRSGEIVWKAGVTEKFEGGCVVTAGPHENRNLKSVVEAELRKVVEGGGK